MGGLLAGGLYSPLIPWERKKEKAREREREGEGEGEGEGVKHRMLHIPGAVSLTYHLHVSMSVLKVLA